MPSTRDRRRVRFVRHWVLSSATVIEDAVRALGRGLSRFYNSNDMTFASSVAYFALMSLFPCLMLLLALLGSATASEADRTRVVEFLLNVFPRQFEFLTTQLDAFRGQHVTLGLAGGVLAAWGALGVFGAVTTAVNHAWRVEKHPNYLKHKLVSFLMLLATGAVIMLTLFVVSLRGVVHTSWFATLLNRSVVVSQIMALATGVMPSLLVTGALGFLFYLVPNTKVRFRDVWIGAALTGSLWRLAFMAFSWYVRDMSRFSIHGSLATVIMFLLWVYVSSVILLFGVEYTAAYAQMRRLRLADLYR